MSATADVITRVDRRYRNEVARQLQAHGKDAPREERIRQWLAGVSFEEWFQLVRDLERAEEALRVEQEILARRTGELEDEKDARRYAEQALRDVLAAYDSRRRSPYARIGDMAQSARDYFQERHRGSGDSHIDTRCERDA